MSCRTLRVIKRDASDPFASFTISVGSLHGVERGDPVITPDGLVGCVDVVEETQSIVRTVLDNSIGIGAMDSHTQTSGQISANTLTLARDDKCRMNNIKRENAISRGDIIITSGVGKGYPRGLIIGTVEEVLQESDGISNYAIVKPAADVRNVRNVMVIKDFTATPIPDESVTGDGVELNEARTEKADREMGLLRALPAFAVPAAGDAGGVSRHFRR